MRRSCRYHYQLPSQKHYSPFLADCYIVFFCFSVHVQVRDVWVQPVVWLVGVVWAWHVPHQDTDQGEPTHQTAAGRLLRPADRVRAAPNPDQELQLWVRLRILFLHELHRTLTLHSQEWSISNFPCSLTRNIKSHIMKNLAFHSLLWWMMITLPFLITSFIHFSLKGCENVVFELGFIMLWLECQPSVFIDPKGQNLGWYFLSTESALGQYGSSDQKRSKHEMPGVRLKWRLARTRARKQILNQVGLEPTTPGILLQWRWSQRFWVRVPLG